MIEEPYDKGDHIKSVFAYFGRAYYMANVFETGLAIALMQLDFLTDVMARLRRKGGPISTARATKQILMPSWSSSTRRLWAVF